MRLRNPTHANWDDDPLPANFAQIADENDNHEMFEVREVSSDAAVPLLADGWMLIDEAREGRFVSWEEVDTWLASWGTDHEPPHPVLDYDEDRGSPIS